MNQTNHGTIIHARMYVVPNQLNPHLCHFKIRLRNGARTTTVKFDTRQVTISAEEIIGKRRHWVTREARKQVKKFEELTNLLQNQ